MEVGTGVVKSLEAVGQIIVSAVVVTLHLQGIVQHAEIGFIVSILQNTKISSFFSY